MSEQGVTRPGEAAAMDLLRPVIDGLLPRRGSYNRCRRAYDAIAEAVRAEERERDGRGAALIATERARQIEAEGWTPEHDAEHDRDDLVSAARAYLEQSPRLWPWESRYWRPSPADRERELVKAGALIAAEIDRLAARLAREEPTDAR